MGVGYSKANDDNPFARVGGYTGGALAYNWSTGTVNDYRGASYVSNNPVDAMPTFRAGNFSSGSKVIQKQDSLLGVQTLNALPGSNAWWSAISGYDQPTGAYGDRVTTGVPTEEYSIISNVYDDKPGESVLLNVNAPKVNKQTYTNWRNGRNPANGS